MSDREPYRWLCITHCIVCRQPLEPGTYSSSGHVRLNRHDEDETLTVGWHHSCPEPGPQDEFGSEGCFGLWQPWMGVRID